MNLYLLAVILMAFGIMTINATTPSPRAACQSQHTLNADACYLELTK